MRLDLSRTGDKEPRVGNLLQPTEKFEMKELIDEYGEETCTPAVYEDEITFRDAEELKSLGIGASAKVVGDNQAADLGDEL